MHPKKEKIRQMRTSGRPISPANQTKLHSVHCFSNRLVHILVRETAHDGRLSIRAVSTYITRLMGSATHDMPQCLKGLLTSNVLCRAPHFVAYTWADKASSFRYKPKEPTLKLRRKLFFSFWLGTTNFVRVKQTKHLPITMSGRFFAENLIPAATSQGIIKTNGKT